LPYGEGYPVEVEDSINGDGDGEAVEDEGEGGVVAPPFRRLALILQPGGFNTVSITNV
jgi:hypothetical protein